jgi:hypothetical protein
MLKAYSKGERTYKSKWGKWRKRGTVPVESENCVRVPTWRFPIFKVGTLSASVGLPFIIIPLI